MGWWRRLTNAIRPDDVDDEIRREMEFHLEERADDLVAGGLSRRDARREARRRFGNLPLQAERTRDVNLLSWLETSIADLRYALRGLRRSPGFTAVTVLSLALGIGANTSVFTLINVFMLKSLPVRDPDRLVLIQPAGNGSKGSVTVSQPVWEQFRDHFDALAGSFAYGSTSTDISTGGEVRPIAVGLVTGGFFTTLGVRAAAGRTLVDGDEGDTCQAVAVITHAFWQTEYGGRPDVVGRSISVNGRPFEIVGVTEPGFFGVEFGYYAPIWALQCAGRIIRGPGGSAGGGWVMGRLKPGITLEQASARLSAMTPAVIDATLPSQASAAVVDQYRRTTFTLKPFAKGLSSMSRSYTEAMFVLVAIVAIVLLIACANVANLLLARATARRREMAVRLALGASRARLVRQALTESVVLSLAGALLALGFARWSSAILLGLVANRGQIVAVDLAPDAVVLAFTLGVSVLTALVFGGAPALASVMRGRSDELGALAGRGIAEGRNRFGIGKALVAGQIALSLVMIAAAGLFVGSWWRMAAIDPGFRGEGVLLAGVNLRPARVAPDARLSTYERIADRLRAIPGVDRVSLAWRTPFGNTNANVVLDVEGFTPATPDAARVSSNDVGAGYFAAIGQPILAGRDFTSADQPTSSGVAIVNEALARMFFGGDALGRRLRLSQGGSPGNPIDIVGVVANIKENDLRDPDKPMIYFPISQNRAPAPAMTFAVHLASGAANAIPATKAAILEIEPRASLDVRPLDQQVADSLRLRRTLGLLSGFFGVLALLLASIGLYGIMSYSVARRRNEIGVRIALGARRADVVGMVLTDVGRLMGAGLGLGLLLTITLTRLVATFLYGVTPTDPSTLALSALMLTGVAFAAAALPARRAARLDPVAALRE
jgi:putative ABC transport system permease protein